MRYCIILISILTVFSCKQDVENIQLLDGYWEIENVTFKDGSNKEYTTNQTAEHFILGDNLEGRRVKVMPLLDGTFEVVADGENIKASNEDGLWTIQYHTDFSNWTETVKKLDQEHLELLNEDGKTYIYKRYTLPKQP